MVERVIADYSSAGWYAIDMQPRRVRTNPYALADVIAIGDNHRHFIQIMTAETAGDKRFASPYRGNFVQNAMSNDAIPVWASIDGARGQKKDQIVYYNVNTGSRINLHHRKSAETTPGDSMV